MHTYTRFVLKTYPNTSFLAQKQNIQLFKNNYFLNRVKSSTFLSLIFVGGHKLPKSVANHEGRRAGQGGIGRQGKGEPDISDTNL